MRAVVFGAGGLLGQTLRAGLPPLGVEIAGAYAGRAECDIADAGAVERVLAQHRPDVVFNSAAYTNVDGAEDHQDEAFRINALGAETIARACARAGARFVHYSTDFVFDGEREQPYDESVPPSPISVYGRSKLEGDQRALAACPRTYVIRVGCIYGAGGRNFPSTVLRRLRAGERIRADGDRKASPTWIVPIVPVSVAVARTEQFGVFHATSQGETSWADFARYMAEAAGLDPGLVESVPYGSLRMKAARPRRAILDNLHLRTLGLDTLEDWRAQARAYIAATPASPA